MRGLSLIEILIVIVIIGILASVLTISATSFVEGQKHNNTIAIINALDAGCKRYKNDHHKYPPQEYTVPNLRKIVGSECLHYFLGKRRQKIEGDVKAGELEPYVDFKGWWLKSNPEDPDPTPSGKPPNICFVVDAWGNDINYNNPGIKFNKSGVDIWTERGFPADETMWIVNK